MAGYHEQHRDDPDEWDATGEMVMPRRTGMAVYSLRLPMAELAALKADADARHLTVSDCVRRAIRTQLATSASADKGGGDVRESQCVCHERAMSVGYWEWVYSEDGLRYDYLVDGQRAAVVWLARGERWEDEEWSVAWIGRGFWDSPHAQQVRPQSMDEAMRQAEAFLAHPERFETPAEWQRRQACAADQARQEQGEERAP